VQVVAYDPVCFLICVSQPARYLFSLFDIRYKRKIMSFFITRLDCHAAEINAIAVDPCRCAGFKAAQFQTQFSQAAGESD
jgi:hypothetical protein